MQIIFSWAVGDRPHGTAGKLVSVRHKLFAVSHFATPVYFRLVHSHRFSQVLPYNFWEDLCVPVDFGSLGRVVHEQREPQHSHAPMPARQQNHRYSSSARVRGDARRLTYWTDTELLRAAGLELEQRDRGPPTVVGQGSVYSSVIPGGDHEGKVRALVIQ